jgi:hypothetical protein
LATRSARGGSSRPSSGKPRRGATPLASEHGGDDELEDISERAARLGITVERVLLEYASIAFADLRHLVEWGPDGIRIKSSDEVSEEDARAISEIVPGTDPAHSRVKLYDKKAALDAIARHLGMFPPPARRQDADTAPEEADDPREFLARELARLAAGGGAQ